MKLGAICFFTEYSISPAELGPVLEDLGYESMWVGDHSHIPLPEGQSAGIDTRTGKPVPTHYSHLVDPFLALAYAAAVTTDLGLGTSVCLINERDPITTAKMVGTLDALSGGRFTLGVGSGWNAQEMWDHGTDPATKYPQMKERVLAMKRIWTEEVASFDGDHVRFGPMLCHPKPVQDPHPPVYIGGNWKNIPRVVDYGDGWIPSTSVAPAEAFLTRIDDLQQAAEKAGRGRIPITALHTNATNVEEVDVGASGAFTDDDWDTWEAAGVDRTVLILPPERDSALRMAEHYARFASRQGDADRLVPSS